MSNLHVAVRKIVSRIKSFFKQEPELPEDPYSYVRAPKKPRLPGRVTAAVADLPEE